MTPTEKSYLNPVRSGQDFQVRKPLAGDVAITTKLDSLTVEGVLYYKLKNRQVHCFACGHNCIIRPGGRGVCQVRFNSGGKLFVPWGYVAALHIDPIEKKPFYHVYPGSDALTFGMLGCDLHCPYCQNWDISQTLRDKYAGHPPNEITPERIIEYAKRSGAKTVVSSYNEPLITSEWAAAIFKLANKAGYDCLYVSNGNGTKEVLEYLRPLMSGYKIDLKSMNDKNYRKLGCPLKTVLETIGMAYRMGFWVEIVTLVVPGFNNSDEELRDMARFIKSISADIPWHLSAFHKDYKMTEPENTTVKQIIRAVEIGYSEGLHFVYGGNIPAGITQYENTFCPQCKTVLIKRSGYRIDDYRITAEGRCPECKIKIAGIWAKSSVETNVSRKSGYLFCG